MSANILSRGLTRRQFLKATGATTVLAAMGAKSFGSTSTLIEVAAPTAPSEGKWTPTACWVGKQGCLLNARVVNGVVAEFRGYPDDPRHQGRPCLKGPAQLLTMYDPYRIKTPLVRTNAKGQSGQWKEVTWDEALTLVADKVNEIRKRDINKLIFQTGGSKQGMVGRTSLMNALGTTNSVGSATCFQALGDANGYTIGFNAGTQSDLHYTNYVLIWGSSMKDGGPSGLCWATWQNLMREARERGMKAVLIDPRREGGANMVDEWLPIKPSTDLAMFLALANVLIANGYVDKKFLTQTTNSTFLLQNDGHFARKDNKALIWDTKTNSAQPFDSKDAVPALEGIYNLNGAQVKTVYEALKAHVANLTPEWAAPITGLSADSIRKVALDLGENAKIGSTIVVDGVTLPYRPVGMMSYHGLAQQESGFQTGRASNIVFMLLGAIQAVGGTRVGFTLGVDPSFDRLDTIKMVDKATDIRLTNTKFFPLNNGSGALPYHAMANAAKYGAEAYVPEVMVTLYGNPFLANTQRVVMDGLKSVKFMASIESHMTEELDYLADVVLPCATIEKLDGIINVRNQYEEGVALRLPIIPPLYQSKSDMEIYMALAEKAGVLLGKDGFVDRLNAELGLKAPNLLDANVKPTPREVFDKWAKTQGQPDGVKYFEEHALTHAKIPAVKLYAPAWTPPYGGIKYRMYGESLLTYQEQMKQKGLDKIYWQDYTGFPVWREPTMRQSPAEYDLLLVDYKSLPFFHSQATYNPILHEQRPEQTLQMNVETAKAKGLADGDYVWLESHNAVTGQTNKVKVKVETMQGMRPDTVGLFHGYGHWVHPISKGSGPSASQLYFSGEGYVATPDSSSVCRTKVKVTQP